MKPTEYKMGDVTFYIHIMPPLVAMRVLGELQKTLAPILGSMTKEVTANSDKQIDGLEVIGAALGEALKQMPAHLDGERLEMICKLLLNGDYIGVSTDGLKAPTKLSEATINEVFTGRPFDILILMYKVFEVNFLDFSRLSGVPIGVRNALGELKKTFTANVPTNSSE